VIAEMLLAASVLVPASAGAGTARPTVSLVASPSHVMLAGKARRTIRVTNSGGQSVVVDLARAGFALDLRGRPRIVPRGSGRRVAASWLTVRPQRLMLTPGGSASFTISSRLPRRVGPGDHDALVLLTTRPRRRSGVAVKMRLGIVVVVRVPGVIVRRLELLGLRVGRAGRARLLELSVANRGNITEALDRTCLSVSLRRRGRELARLSPAARDLLPRTIGIVEIRYRGRLRGRITARVEHSGRAPCGRGLRRTFPIQL
jgi:hypothetical protein